MSVVYTGGTFDLFHVGHVNLLRNCWLLAGENGKVVVSLNTDEFIEEYKKTKPVFSFNERKSILKSCKYVSEVIENIGGKDSKISINQVNPDIIVIGTDWATKDYYTQMGFTQDWLDKNSIVLCYVPYTEHISTTKIKSQLKNAS